MGVERISGREGMGKGLDERGRLGDEREELEEEEAGDDEVLREEGRSPVGSKGRLLRLFPRARI